MSELLQNLRVAWRRLAKNPGVTLVAALSLAIGSGANTAVFTLVDAFVFRPLPFQNPNRLVHLWETTTRGGTTEAGYRFPIIWIGSNKAKPSATSGYFDIPEKTLQGRASRKGFR